jgi:hypothetical protein
MSNFTENFNTPGDFTLSDSSKVEVAGGLFRLKEILTNVYARWHLNEFAGAAVPDDSGNNRDGIAANMEDADWVAAKLNNGLVFDGTNEYVNCSDIANFERTQTFSLVAWIKTSGADGMIVSRRQAGPTFRGWFFQNAAGQIGFGMANNNGTGDRLLVRTTASTFNDNAWHHVVATYDGSSTAAGCHVYVDSNDEALTVFFDALTATIVNTAPCNISGYNNGTDTWAGTLDEIVIFDKELDQTDVNYLYNSTTGRENYFYYSTTEWLYKTTGYSDIIHALVSFSRVLGPGNVGSFEWQWSEDAITWKYHNGSAWATAATLADRNTTAEVITNLVTFPTTGANKIYYRAIPISNSGQDACELDSLNIGYVDDLDPLVYAGTNKSTVSGNTIKPFSDATWSDDGTIDHAYYRVDGEEDVWVEIPQGGYGTLLLAVQDFDYTYNNTGTIFTRLRAEDDAANSTDDALKVTVSAFAYVNSLIELECVI